VIERGYAITKAIGRALKSQREQVGGNSCTSRKPSLGFGSRSSLVKLVRLPLFQLPALTFLFGFM